MTQRNKTGAKGEVLSFCQDRHLLFRILAKKVAWR